MAASPLSLPEQQQEPLNSHVDTETAEEEEAPYPKKGEKEMGMENGPGKSKDRVVFSFSIDDEQGPAPAARGADFRGSSSCVLGGSNGSSSGSSGGGGALHRGACALPRFPTTAAAAAEIGSGEARPHAICAGGESPSFPAMDELPQPQNTAAASQDAGEVAQEAAASLSSSSSSSSMEATGHDGHDAECET